MFKKFFVVALCLLAFVLLLNSCDSSTELDHSVIVPAGIGLSQARAVSFLDSNDQELTSNIPAGIRVTVEPLWDSPVDDESIAYGCFADAVSVSSGSKAKYKDFEGSQTAINLGWVSQGFWKISVVAYDSWNASSVSGTEIYLGESIICFTTSNSTGAITLKEKNVPCTLDLSAGVKVPALSNDPSRHYIVVRINETVKYLTAVKDITTVTKETDGEDVDYKTTLKYYFDGTVAAHTGSNSYSVQFCEVKGSADYEQAETDEEDLVIGGMAGVFFAKGNVKLSGALNPAEFVNSSVIIKSESMRISIACSDSTVISNKSAALNTPYTFTVTDDSKNMASLVWNFDGYEFSTATDNEKFKAESITVNAATGEATMRLTVKVRGNHTLSCVATSNQGDIKDDQKIKFTILG